jgi:V/A-type H+-transporting ATPase subunit D
MAKLNVAPTKSNQLRLRDDLKMASEGFSLLDQKREILVMELMRLMNRVKLAQEKLDTARKKAFETGRKAFTQNGYHRMRRVSNGIHYEHDVKVKSRVVAGVRLPDISTHSGKLTRQFGLAHTDSLVDATMADFLALMEAIGEMAQLETSVWLLARELKKTQRRVNALEQIFIPDFEDTLRYIGETLESKELEAFSMMKMIKAHREEAEEDVG